MFENKAFVLY